MLEQLIEVNEVDEEYFHMMNLIIAEEYLLEDNHVHKTIDCQTVYMDDRYLWKIQHNEDLFCIIVILDEYLYNPSRKKR